MLTKLWGLRWWMMALLMVGSVIKYLTRATLAVAAPTVLKVRQSLQTGDGRPSSTIALLPRVDDRRVRAGALPADGWPGVCYDNSSKFHYFYVSRDEEHGKHLRVISALPDQVTSDAFTPPIVIAGGVSIERRVEVDYERLRFGYRVQPGAWQWLPQQFDASILSDEASAPGLPTVTGAFVGMARQDLAGTGMPADFDWFEYRKRNYAADVSRLENP